MSAAVAGLMTVGMVVHSVAALSISVLVSAGFVAAAGITVFGFTRSGSRIRNTVLVLTAAILVWTSGTVAVHVERTRDEMRMVSAALDNVPTNATDLVHAQVLERIAEQSPMGALVFIGYLIEHGAHRRASAIFGDLMAYGEVPYSCQAARMVVESAQRHDLPPTAEGYRLLLPAADALLRVRQCDEGLVGVVSQAFWAVRPKETLKFLLFLESTARGGGERASDRI